MRYMRPFVLLAATSVLVIAADILAQTGWEQASFEDACFQALRHPDSLTLPPIPARLKALALAQRRSTVEALGARAKAYYASEAFKSRWAQAHGGAHVDPARAAATEAEQAKGMAAARQGLAQMEQMIPMMPPEQQAKMRAQVAKAKADMARQEGRSKSKAAGQAVPDPREALKGALQTFLRESQAVDFAAPTRTDGVRTVFTNPAHEGKSHTWKALFRAGREANEAARAYAKAWLLELK